MSRERRTPRVDDGWEPTFDDFLTARRVMVWVRKWLEGQGEHVTLSECPIFSQVVLRSSPVCDPALFESTQLASAEGLFVRPVQTRARFGG
jgi:hypothetical protein